MTCAYVINEVKQKPKKPWRSAIRVWDEGSKWQSEVCTSADGVVRSRYDIRLRLSTYIIRRHTYSAFELPVEFVKQLSLPNSGLVIEICGTEVGLVEGAAGVGSGAEGVQKRQQNATNL